MKKIVSIIVLLINCNLTAQDFVQNGSFEQYIQCPQFLGSLDYAESWFNPQPLSPPDGSTPDFYHACSTGIVDVPNTVYGYQEAFEGDGFVGVVVFASSSSEYREYLVSPLDQSLQQDSCYSVSLNFTLGNFNFSSDAIQIYFSDTIIQNLQNNNVLPYIPHVSNAIGNYPDTSAWTSLSNMYHAQGGESYIVIGNFYDDENTGLITVNNLGFAQNYSYLFIDNVSVVPVQCETTGWNEHSDLSNIRVFPNPTEGNFNLDLGKIHSSIDVIVRNAFGQEIQNNKYSASRHIDLLITGESGVYIVEVIGKNKRAILRIVKI